MIKLFLYDELLNPFSLQKLLRNTSIITVKPAYVNMRLMKKGRIIGFTDSISHRYRDSLTFGTYYELDMTESDLEKLREYYEFSGLFEESTIQSTTITFKSLKEFLNNRFEPEDVNEVITFIGSDLSIYKNRHFAFGNFYKEFLAVYLK